MKTEAARVCSKNARAVKTDGRIYNTSITDGIISENKVLIRITNVLVQSIPHRKNTSLFYIYDDGTCRKEIFIE